MSNAYCQGTAFTYQGQLQLSNARANGSYDFRFGLFAQSAAGANVGNLVTNLGISTTNGQFTVTLDFGSVFDGTPYWLEIGVRTNGSIDNFTTLSPRQPITSTPYAVTAGNLTGSVQTSQLIGVLQPAQFPAALPAANAINLTNFPNYLTPKQFGAACDGITDDSAAVSNMFYALNTGNIRVIDGLGRTNKITYSPGMVRVPNVEIKNLRINAVGSFPIISHTNDGWQITDNFWVHDDILVNSTGTNSTSPTPNSIGICLTAGSTGAFWDNVTIERNKLIGFWDGIDIGGGTETTIRQNQIWGVWSNCVHSVYNGADPDMVEIAYNDLDQDGGLITVPQQYTNVIAIQFDNGNIGVDIHHNNIGRLKQVFWDNPATVGAIGIHIHDNECERLFTANPNQCPLEFWNASGLRWENNNISVDGVFGSSNYLAQVGLYSTSSANQNFSAGYLMQPGGLTMDVWHGAPPVDGYYLPRNPGRGTIILHTAFRDTGTNYQFFEPGTYGIAQTGNGIGTLLIQPSQNGDMAISINGGQHMLDVSHIGPVATAHNSWTFADPINVGEIDGQKYADRGGQAALLIWPKFTHNVWLTSTNINNPDFVISNGVAYAMTTLTIGGMTNTPTGTIIQTNFISGELYTNIYGRPISVSVNACLTGSSAAIAILASGYLTNYATGSICTNVVSMVIPPNQQYTFTNLWGTAELSGGQILVQ